ncbi:class I SAM-dependent methyltransferase [Phytoactinopolyspora halotolerans]|uniref:Class I SAM-dependent methyltransferase n=1 Tax=Phytoactinopolyspora halotolerans TaxID=1981512 RepID=A0A6L9S4Z0_9ACTN|nr:class I SAM-dependent methyltransferase [Phytoactinopolyspora halotolerans]NEE00169.1 class I SAM-dependent methyltransferase [Phytoactinopolyspora halotolerans]
MVADVPPAYDAARAQDYDAEQGHGFTLPGERECWLADVGLVLQPYASRLPADPLVLDIGCGTGKFTRLIRDVLGETFGRAPTVHGVDASDAMLEVARRRDTRKIEYRLADARTLTGPACYDLVVSCQVLDSFERPAELLDTWRRELLKPGGVLLTVLSFSAADGWTNRTSEQLDRQPLATVASIEPLVDATGRAGFGSISAGFLRTVSPLHGGASTGLVGPVGSRYYAVGYSVGGDGAVGDAQHPPGE